MIPTTIYYIFYCVKNVVIVEIRITKVQNQVYVSRICEHLILNTLKQQQQMWV